MVIRANWFHVLAALASGDLHGSAIADDVFEQTGGELRLWPATLYGALDDMVGAGLIEELAGDAHPKGVSRRKRHYRLTAVGKSELDLAAQRLAAFADTARIRLSTAPS